MNILDRYFKGSWSKFFVGMLVGAFLVSTLIFLKTSSLLAGFSSEAARPLDGYYDPYIPEFPDVSRYDIDLSGQANYEDSLFISAFVAGTGKSCPVARCDISGDGRVTSYDASLLAKALIKVYDVDRNLKLDNNDPAYIARSVAGQDPRCAVNRCDIDGSGTVSSHDAAVLSQIVQTFPH